MQMNLHAKTITACCHINPCNQNCHWLIMKDPRIQTRASLSALSVCNIFRCWTCCM